MGQLKIKDGSSWINIPASGDGLPLGGNSNQVLVKASSSDFDAGWRNILDLVYPVGSIYMSVNSTSPETLFGGTWIRISGCFLLAATDGGAQGGNGNASIAAGYTGGEATHTLTISEMPSHNHNTNIRNSGNTSSANRAQWDKYGSDNIGTTYTGGGNAHNNMPPYLSVYVWKRTV